VSPSRHGLGQLHPCRSFAAGRFSSTLCVTTGVVSTNYSAMLPAFLTTVLFAISAVSANRTTRLLGGVVANFWRITLATIFLGLWAHTVGQGFSGAAFWIFFLSGCAGFGIGDLALYQTLPRLGSRLSMVFVHCLAAPFAAVMEWLWLGTSLSTVQMLCSLMILIGVGVALAPSEHLHLSRRVLTIGAVFGTCAAFGQGFGAVLSRKAYQITELASDKIDGLSAAYQRILAGWIVAAIFYALLKQRSLRSPAPAGALGVETKANWQQAHRWILLNALAGPTLGVGCYQWALATTKAGVVLPIVAITPLLVIPFARLVEGENPTPRALIGGLIAVAGAVALARVRH
jgi:drug/metabolite transporter (DMT)-like permease